MLVEIGIASVETDIAEFDIAVAGTVAVDTDKTVDTVVDMAAVRRAKTDLLVVFVQPDCFDNGFCIHLYLSHTKHRYGHILHLWHRIEGST